jgi:dTDP-4-amino-4,6-dideoxygalactose transaminase
MLRVGQKEIDAVEKVLQSTELFRYHSGGACETFEQRFAKFLGTEHVGLCSSGTAALTAALAGLEIGPGDEVIVPAHTYMATAIAVLAVGAIPVIVDIDESIMMDPDAFEAGIGPRTRAVIPVHMWGALCDMDRILDVARRHNLLVIEDACQCVGGFYGDRAAGAMGDAGAFSFNFYKNMTCGEGGAIVTTDKRVARRARCMIDPCSFYWEGREKDFTPFVNSGSRASEMQGAMLNVQLDRISSLLATLRGNKEEILTRTADLGLTATPRHSPDGECAIMLMYLLPGAEAAEQFAQDVGGGLLSQTGRHTYTEWDPILNRQGAHHPALNPYDLPQNAGCRMDYSLDMCSRSLDILARTVHMALKPDETQDDIDNRVAAIRNAAKELK